MFPVAHRPTRRIPGTRLLVALALLPSLSLPARSLAQAPDSAARWELGVLPTATKLSSHFAGRHVWGGGLTVSATYRPHAYLGVEGALQLTSAPQLNFRDGPTLNYVSPSVVAEVRLPNAEWWQPYATLGASWVRFQYDEAPAPWKERHSFGAVRLGAGARYPVGPRFLWRVELNGLLNGRGWSPTAFAGVTIRSPFGFGEGRDR